VLEPCARRLELDVGLLDRVEVGRVRRQEDESGTDPANGRSHGLALVAAEIVDHDDLIIICLKGWGQNLSI
jgi:hypothetical protein